MDANCKVIIATFNTGLREIIGYGYDAAEATSMAEDWLDEFKFRGASGMCPSGAGHEYSAIASIAIHNASRKLIDKMYKGVAAHAIWVGDELEVDLEVH